MKHTEFEFLTFNPLKQENREQSKCVLLSPFKINDNIYNIPPKIFNKPFFLNEIHLFYRSDEHKVLITREIKDFPTVLTESSEKVYDLGNDQLLIYIHFARMGKGYVRVSLYEEGNAIPLRIYKFKPWNVCNPHLTFGFDFAIPSGNYFLLFDNMETDLDQFNSYQSVINEETEDASIFEWRGRNSFGTTFSLPNGMLVMPFRIYPKNNP